MKTLQLRRLELGGGRVQAPEAAPPDDIWRMQLPCTKTYADAQLDDTSGCGRKGFYWNPPVRLSLQARVFPARPLGTFGFGFWNDPFSMTLGMGGATRKWPAAPHCAWFFYISPPGDLPLASGVPGYGWKAATLQSRILPSVVMGFLALGGALLSLLPQARGWIFSQAKKYYAAHETVLSCAPAEWHSYAIDWQTARVAFYVDGALVLESLAPPAGPLGLVLWIDNQYAVASAKKGFGFGVLPLAQTQGMEIRRLRIEPGTCA